MAQSKKYLILNNGMSSMLRIIFVLFLTFSSMFSQDPNWTSDITFPQYPSPYFTDWERNPNIGNLIINYTGTAPVEFYFEVVITIDEYGEAIRGRTENREYLSGPVSEMLTFNDISDWKSSTVNADLERVIIQTGKLPESNYSICVTTHALNGELLTDACTDFDIALPNPPQLITPEEEGSIEIAQPTFMWNPVSVPPDWIDPVDPQVYYQIRVVEILDGQTSYRALEANVPIVKAEVPNENMYIYRLDDYPLEQNHSYAWQVQATNNEGVPLSSNEGYSEIWQFTYGSAAGEVGIDTLTLIEDFAYLLDLKQLNITDNNAFLNLDGSCQMMIKGADGINKFADVFAQNLMLQKDREGYEKPVFLGGSVLGSIYDELIGKDITGEFFKPTEIEFLPPNQLTIGGNFYLGENVDIPLNGKLNFIDGELTGVISLFGDPTAPVFGIGDDSFKLNITSLELSYPDIESILKGSLTVFGTPSNCNVNEINLDKDGTYSANISCNINQEISMLQGSTLFVLNVNSIQGSVSGNLLTDKVEYKILVDGGMNFNVNPENAFGADVVFELAPNKFNLISFEPSGDVEASNIDFGWVKWNMRNLNLNDLSYQNKIWDFDLSMDIDISFPDFSDEKLPTINGISFTPKGFEFPKIDFSNFSIPEIDFQAFELELFGISMPAFTFDLSKYSPGTIAQMDFDWRVKFNMPNLPNGTDDDFRFPNWDLKASIKDGNFNLDLPELSFPGGHNIALPGGTRFNVNSFSGKLNTSFDGSLMNFLPDVKIGGEITLPEALQCDGKTGSMKLESMITLNGNGSISGVIEDVVPKCPINIGLASFYMKKSKLEFKNEDGQKIYLDGNAGVKFTNDPRQKEVGEISVIYEVLNNEIVKAEGKINEKFTWDLSGENPTFSFEVEEAIISDGKLEIDGRAEFVLDDGEKMGATFDKFTIDLDEYTIEDGKVIFDELFAMVVEELDNDEIAFKAVSKGNIPKTDTFIYYELPDKIALDKNGFTVSGKSKAIMRYQGKKLDDLTTVFSDDFAFSLKPFKVSLGRCDFFIEKERVAYFNMDGFFPDPNYFLNRVIPDKIPLPTLEIAYLQIKQNDNLLIDLSIEGNSTRFSTRDGEPVELVFPSLQFDLAEAPKILVDFDISIDDVTGEVTDGFIRGVIPEESIPTFDLTRVGIPYTINSVYYGNIDGINKFRLTGKAKLFETEVVCQDSMILTLAQNGILEGNVSCDIEQIIPLIPDSDKLNLHLNTVSGVFNADLLNLARNFDFDLQLDSDVRFNMSEDESWGVWTLLGLNFEGLRLIDHRIDDVAIPKIDLDQFKIGIENFTLGRLDYNSTPDADGNSGWDFEFGMDLDLEFPELGLELPNIPNVTLNKTGFHTMNRISIPSFPDSLAFEFQGIELKPLAFRMPRLNFNWFNPLGGGEGNNWDFDIDFEINFPNIGDGSGEMRYPHLTMLDASFLNGMIIGNIELSEFDLLDGLKLNFGDGAGFSVTGISGGLFDDNGSQGVGFNFNGHFELPEYMRCDGEETSVDLTEATFSLNSSGHIAGIVENFVPRCPIDLGFGHFVVTSSSINFSVADSGQVAILDMTGDLVIDAGDDNTVTANGMLQMDLLTGQIIDGSITIEEQFVWAIPNDKPVLRFTINRAVLDMDGLTIDGESDLLLPGGQTRRANFRNFKFDYRKYKVKSGSLEIDADFAIKIALEEGKVVWTTIPADEPLSENQTAKIGFTSNLVLDANGLSTSGEAIAAIRWDEDPAHQFGNLKIRYTNDFKFSLRPFKVSEGRADLIHMLEGDENIIATLTHDGLNLGDIFGLIPIPEIIPLPNRDIAYLRIKSGDRVLVESEMVDGNLRITSTEERPAALVIPSLQKEGTPVDSIDAIFNILINPVSLQIVEGEITLVKGDSLSIINLRNRGIPADIFKLHYGEDNEGVYRLTADAQVDLPGIMDGMPIKMRKLRFDDDGLSGSVNLGTYSDEYDDEIETIVQTQLGEEAIITLEGVDVSFGDNNTVGFSGKFIPSMLARGEDITKIQYAANWDNEASKFGFSFDFEAGEYFDFGIGRFTPSDLSDDKPAMKLSLMEDDFELVLNGRFEAEQFGDDFDIFIEGLTITKDSVSAEAISKLQASPIQFKLFNSDFRIFDKDVNNKAIRFEYADNVLKLILNGDITLFGKEDKVTFTNLTLGTDGSFSIDEANFLNRDLTIVDNYIVLNELGISDNKLAIGGWVKIPEPVGSEKQFDFKFRIGPDGNVDGEFNPGIDGIERVAINGKSITTVFIDEPQRIGNPTVTEYDFWKAKFDVTYLALDLNFANIGNSSVQMVSDIYWDNNEDKRVSLGNKSNMNSIVPGLRITFAPEEGKYVHWGTASVNANLVNFDEDMFKVKITTVQLTSDESNNLTFGINGEFGLNFDAVEGGLELSNFIFNKTGIVDIGSITGGTISIADVGALSLRELGYSSDGGTIEVNGGEMPGVESGNMRSSTQSIRVNSYLSFSGTISVAGLGGAGVERFLSYSETDEDGEVSNTLIIKNAFFEINDKMDATLDLLYYSGGNGFLMRVAGSANFTGKRAAMVGKIAKIDGEVSFGFFLSFSTQIQVGFVTITEVGGGFFLNPTDDDINTVKRVARVVGDNANGRIETKGGSFALFVFGEAVILDDYLIKGRLLLTLTDNQFMLDGNVILLNRGDEIKGEIHLMIDWSDDNFQAEGEITININVASVINGDGRLGFYVYSADQWAIYGDANAELFSFFELSSEFYVGNSGFMLGMSSSVDFDLWIIEVGAGIEVKVWYIQNQSWGAYAEAYVRAEMLWGVAKARGWLKCALINSSGTTYLYGQAGLSIHVLWTDWSGSAWAKIANGRVTGGTGSDSDMDALIAEAAGQSAAAEREMDEMKASIESRPAPSPAFSDEELLEIFGELSELGRKFSYGTPAERVEAAQIFSIMSINEVGIYQFLDELNRPEYEYQAVHDIIDIYKGVGAPNLTEYQNNKQSVDSIIAVYSETLTEVIPLLDADFETIDAIESVDAQTTEDPTVGSSFASYTMDSDGNYELTTEPSLNLDEDIVNANRNNMRSAESAAINYKREVTSKLLKINENIGVLESALVGDDAYASGGLEKTATKYASLISNVSNAYKTEFKYSREMELWAREKKVVHGGSNRALFLTNLSSKSRDVYDYANDFGVLRTLATGRLSRMNRLLGKSDAEVNRLSVEEQGYWFDEFHKIRDEDGYTESDFRTWSTNRTSDIGVQMWASIPREGLEAVIEQSVSNIRENHSNRRSTLEDMGSVQAQFTTKLNRLYYALSDLSETKYDILNQLIGWEERDADPNKPQTDLNNLINMKNELTAKMEVPTISSVVAGEQDMGLYSYAIFQWSVQGANNRKIKSMVDFNTQNPTVSASGSQAVGSARRFTLYYTPLPDQTTFGRTSFKVKVRNQVGYSIHRTLEFTPRFSNRTAEAYGGILYNRAVQDDTPPIMASFLDKWNYNFRVVEDDATKFMYFTDDSSRFEESWSARDPQTGIQEYRYRFINVRNPEINDQPGFVINDNINLAVNPVLDGRPILGLGDDEDNEELYADWTSNLGRDNVVLNDLNLLHNRVYQLQVVAKNGDGLWSEAIAGENQYYYSDLTPPTRPALPFTIVQNDIDIPASGLGGRDFGFGGKARNVLTYSVNPLLSENNIPNGAIARNTDFDNSDAQIELIWEEAEDPQSGIFRYELQATNMRDQTIVSNWKQISRNRTEYTFNNSINAFNEMFNFVDSFKVAVRAINYAKIASKSSERIYKITDLTSPTKPNVAAVDYANGDANVVGLVFSEHASDPHVGIDRYEVAVGSEPNGEFDLLSWSDAITFRQNQVSYNGRRNIRIPADNNVSYIAVRAVNRNGLKGRLCYTGPFYQDATRPETPSAELDIFNIVGRGKTLAIGFSNVADNESGIREVKYNLDKKVEGNNRWYTVFNWRTADNITNARVFFDRENIEDNTTYLKLSVRSTNNRGINSYDGRFEYRMPDETPPFAPTVTINSGSPDKNDPKMVGLTFGNINDPESGIQKIEYKIEKVSASFGSTYSTIKGWGSNGTRTSKAFTYSRYNLRSGQSIRISVRTVNNDGLASSVVKGSHTLD